MSRGSAVHNGPVVCGELFNRIGLERVGGWMVQSWGNRSVAFLGSALVLQEEPRIGADPPLLPSPVATWGSNPLFPGSEGHLVH